MPDPSRIILPAPEDPSEFEDMVCDYCKTQYGPAQRYGRSGQSQQGVDILCNISSTILMGVQCKRMATLTTDDFDAIIGLMDTFPQELHMRGIATTAPRDANIQRHILQKRTETGMNILYIPWEDIRHIIAADMQLLERYYPIIFGRINQQNGITTIEQLVADFNEGMRELQILDYLRTYPLDGVPRDLVSNVDFFVYEIERKLLDSILLQLDPKYQAIRTFRNKLNDYCGYCSTFLFSASNGLYTIQSPHHLDRIDEVKTKILEYVNELNELYGQINDGMTIYI